MQIKFQQNRRVFVLLAFLCCVTRFSATADPERSRLLSFDESMVRSTFKIQSGNSLGTAFVLYEPQAGFTNVYSPVLVTAAHVFIGMNSSNAELVVRVKRGDAYEKQVREIRIRANGTNLWTQHRDADVAAIRIPVFRDVEIGMLSTDLLADDARLIELVVHPGDELRVLGYPYGFEANDWGFPILRSGRIASYPLTPTALTKTFLLDFRIFRGNSGGPVYILDQRQFEAGAMNTVAVWGILGLISEEATLNENVSTLTEKIVRTHELGLGVVIHASAIKETIQRLPPPPRDWCFISK